MRDVEIAAEHEVAAALVHTGRPRRELREEIELGRIVLAAVRDINGREEEIAERDGDDARLHVERRMREYRYLVVERLADMQRNARVRAHAVPVHVIVVMAAARGNLVGRRLQLLQAKDVRAVALEPVAELRLPRADAVDVPGGDLQLR